MDLAEKIAKLRKENSWSQEELAERMGISRQSVSKWESGASVPDLDKIIKMSGIFRVTTDYLLKDTQEETVSPKEEVQMPGQTVRKISREEAASYLETTEKISKNIALAVFILISSPICLLLLCGLTVTGTISMTEDMAGGIGVVILLLFAAVGVFILIVKGMQLSRFEYLEKEELSLACDMRAEVERVKEEYEPFYRRCVATGVSLCILGVVPIMIAAAFQAGDLAYMGCVALLLFMVACGVYIFVRTGSVYGSYEKLLEEGEYTREKKSVNKKLSFFPGAYWCIVTAVFLGLGFYWDNWRLAGLIWPVAGVLFAALYGIAGAVAKARAER